VKLTQLENKSRTTDEKIHKTVAQKSAEEKAALNMTW
jgi:hypothetical protein